MDGEITLGRATDESDVKSYAVYYGKSATEKLYLTSIFAAPASGSGDITFSLSVAPPPAGATHLLAFSQNATGEMATGVATALHDVAPVSVDIGAGALPFPSEASYSPIVVDKTNAKILVLTVDDSMAGAHRAVLLRCNYDGSSCSHRFLSDTAIVKSDAMALTLDSADSYLFVAFEDQNNSDKPGLLRCSVDGTSCDPPVDISAGEGQQSGLYPSIAVDAKNGKVLVFTADNSYPTAPTLRPTLFRCNLDGSACTHQDLSLGVADGVYGVFATDEAAQKLFVAGLPQNNYVMCGIDGTDCIVSDAPPISAPFVVSYLSRVATNASAQTLGFAWVSTTTTVGMALCPYDQSLCHFEDVSAGRPMGSGNNPAPVFDTDGGHLYIAMQDSADDDTIHVNRCNLDATACRSFAMSPSLERTQPSIAVVPTASHFVTFANGSIYFPQ